MGEVRHNSEFRTDKDLQFAIYTIDVLSCCVINVGLWLGVGSEQSEMFDGIQFINSIGHPLYSKTDGCGTISQALS